MSNERFFGKLTPEGLKATGREDLTGKWIEYAPGYLGSNYCKLIGDHLLAVPSWMLTPSPYPRQFHTPEFWAQHPGMRWAAFDSLMGNQWLLSNGNNHPTYTPPYWHVGEGFSDYRCIGNLPDWQGDPADSLFENPFFRPYPAELDDPKTWEQWPTAVCGAWDKNERFYCYQNIPKLGDIAWVGHTISEDESMFNDKFTGPWQDSLIMRPKHKPGTLTREAFEKSRDHLKNVFDRLEEVAFFGVDWSAVDTPERYVIVVNGKLSFFDHKPTGREIKARALAGVKGETAPKRPDKLEIDIVPTKDGIYAHLEIACSTPKVKLWFSDSAEKVAPNCFRYLFDTTLYLHDGASMSESARLLALAEARRLLLDAFNDRHKTAVDPLREMSEAVTEAGKAMAGQAVHLTPQKPKPVAELIIKRCSPNSGLLNFWTNSETALAFMQENAPQFGHFRYGEGYFKNEGSLWVEERSYPDIEAVRAYLLAAFEESKKDRPKGEKRVIVKVWESPFTGGMYAILSDGYEKKRHTLAVSQALNLMNRFEVWTLGDLEGKEITVSFDENGKLEILED